MNILELAKRNGFHEDFVEGNDIILNCFAKSISRQAVEEYKAGLVLAVEQSAAIAQLEDKVDAERYRWLRTTAWFDGGLCITDAKDITLGVMTYSHDILDAVIDAKMIEAKS